MPKKISPQSIPETERNNKIYKMYLTGSYSYSSLGRMFKLKRQRIQQIVKRMIELKSNER